MYILQVKNLKGMNNTNYLLLSLLLCIGCQSTSIAQQTKPSKQEVLQEMDQQIDKYGAIAHQIWEFAELGFLEDKSTTLLQDMLKKEGFKVTTGVAGMPTAFVAEYGSGKPVIGLLAEFDALPDMSQKASPVKEADPDRSAGHACGHHLFGTGSMAAAIHTKNWLAQTGTSGTIRLYGTPAEEGGGGKIFMVRAGLFDDADACLLYTSPSPRDRG